jgi:type I restriction enzyme S subunit
MSREPNNTDAKEVAKPLLVPKLRFPEFRGAEGWTPSELGRSATILKGKGIAKADIDPNGSLSCIRYGELYTRYGETISEAVSRTSLPVSELILSNPGDVIIPSSGETKIDIAKASCVLAGGIALGGDLNVIRSKLNGTFLSYFLNGPKRFDIAKVAQGDTVVHLYPHQLEALKISIPSPTEQQMIAECLSSVDKAIAAQARKLDALKTHKKGLMQQLFPREGETQPRRRFREFQYAGEWEVRNVSQFAKVTTGDKDTQNKVEGGKYPFFVRSQTVERINSFSNDGEAVLTSGDGVGVGKNFHYINGKFDFHQRVYCIYDFAKDVSGMFFYLYFSEHFGERVMRMSAKNSVDSVRMAMITEMPVLVPSLPEQHRIAECLSSLDGQIAAETHKHAALQHHKRGLMQQLFPFPEEAES